MNKSKNILLVGGSGYLGSHLRNSISSRSIFFTSTTGKDESIKLDLLDKKTFENIRSRHYEEIIILASTLKGLGTTELKEEYIQLDTLGLGSFLAFVKEHHLTEKIIYVSSMTVYGKNNSLPVKEDGELDPLSTYGLSKLLGENIFSFHCKSSGPKGVILRPPGIYGGDRTSGYIYNTALKCLKNEAVVLNSESLGYWETIHVNDLSDYLNSFIEKYDWKHSIEVFNLSYGRQTDFIECASLIKKALDSASEIRVEGNKGYVDFYLDNSKIRKYVTINDNYEHSLKGYLNSISA